MKKFIATCVSVLLMFVSLSAFAEKTEKDWVKTLRKEVAAAKVSDWRTPAEAARICIEWKTNMNEAYVWLENSIAIKETALNMELKGDYLALNGLYDMAFEYYEKALLLRIDEGKNDFASVQQKIQKLNKERKTVLKQMKRRKKA
ncbi:hypothetical protein [Sediminitomix flava]|uniref:Tetratricopeptide repeat protein n=1 Tax=Sediminitomix flava TaxID=379075 RepID=A0A315YWE5_SEDFL|nr:hypothetical protein [Sediminitomix flava]PWJ34104.1 hypothetical protein BC781_11114 [Sediminitomix flava]